MAPRLLEGFLGAALLLAALAKTADIEETSTALARLGLRRAPVRAVIAVELVTAVALILGVAPAAASTAAVVVGVAFVVVHLRTPTAGCGCLGALDRDLQPGVGLARAGIFLAAALAAWGLRLASGTLGLGWRPTQLLVAGAGAVLAIAALLVAGSILIRRRRLPLHV